jgi:diguanylate cyclase
MTGARASMLRYRSLVLPKPESRLATSFDPMDASPRRLALSMAWLRRRFAMKLLAAPASQLAVVILIAFAGMAGAIDNLQNPHLVATILGLMALGYVGIGLGELRAADSRARGGSQEQRALSESLQAKSAQLDRELATIADLIRSHLNANGRYSDSLAEADLSLVPTAGPEKVRAIVRLLIDANERMRRETSDLAESLEKSQSQVAILRSKLVEAKAIGLRDSLTSLGNRRSFDSHLAKEIAEAQTHKSEMCLVMGDLDHFKKINDNHGHPFGDRVLKHFADLLLKHIKDGDMAARLGGEEFAVILPQTTLENATRLIDQIRIRLESQQWMNAQTGQQFSSITASFGIVRLGEKDDRETLVNRADTMLYEAKRSGRNCIIVEANA